MSTGSVTSGSDAIISILNPSATWKVARASFASTAWELSGLLRHAAIKRTKIIGEIMTTAFLFLKNIIFKILFFHKKILQLFTGYNRVAVHPPGNPSKKNDMEKTIFKSPV